MEGLLSDIPKTSSTPEIRIECSDDTKKEIVESVVSRFRDFRSNGGSPYPVKEINTIDGIRVLFEKGWGLLRASNTQPVIVVRVEAEDEDSLIRYRTFIEAEISKTIEDRG
jgi:phosphomannomutase/phosphoglucomutase